MAGLLGRGESVEHGVASFSRFFLRPLRKWGAHDTTTRGKYLRIQQFHIDIDWHFDLEQLHVNKIILIRYCIFFSACSYEVKFQGDLSLSGFMHAYWYEAGEYGRWTYITKQVNIHGGRGKDDIYEHFHAMKLHDVYFAFPNLLHHLLLVSCTLKTWSVPVTNVPTVDVLHGYQSGILLL